MCLRYLQSPIDAEKCLQEVVQRYVYILDAASFTSHSNSLSFSIILIPLAIESIVSNSCICKCVNLVIPRMDTTSSSFCSRAKSAISLVCLLYFACPGIIHVWLIHLWNFIKNCHPLSSLFFPLNLLFTIASSLSKGFRCIS